MGLSQSSRRGDPVSAGALARLWTAVHDLARTPIIQTTTHLSLGLRPCVAWWGVSDWFSYSAGAMPTPTLPRCCRVKGDCWPGTPSG